MNKNIAFLFPGQGAQYVGMGRDFYDAYPIVRETFEEAEEIVRRPLHSLIFEGPEALLTETRNSQLAIYLLSMALLRVLNLELPHLQPAVCAGLSLGEYSALTASGRLPFASGVELVQQRANYMNDACESARGTMAVVMGLDGPAVEALVAELNLPQDLWAANFNCPGQVVLSGTERGINAGMEAAKARGAKRVLPLQVHGAFHSGLMEAARGRLAEKILQAPLQESPVALVMNVPGDYVDSLPRVRDHLIAQVTQPVRWEQGVRAMDRRGVDLYLEIGCGKTLVGMNRRIGPMGVSENLEKVADLEKIAQLGS
jgi:[acyl-carrier-protein] S-malonyltransferase